MEVRKLKKEEHVKTRELWENIFTEDTPEFLDYYYSVKTAENEIYVIEDNGKICAMLQLNPYEVQVGTQTADAHYIVAVATDERYRRRGLMAKLLRKASEDMRENGEPFTFLMPAAEGIYYPHGFRYVYRQNQGMVSGKNISDGRWQVGLAKKSDCSEIAEFANKVIEKKYEVFAKRDAHYYEVLLEEQASENGGILLVREQGCLVGCFMYAKGEDYELREPLFWEECWEAFAYAVYMLTQDESKALKCLAYGEEEKPMIMAKVLDIPKMFACMEAEREVNLCLEVYDEPNEEYLGRFRIHGSKKLVAEEVTARVEAAQLEPAEEISIGALTSLVFGYLDVDAFELTENFKREWKKIKPLKKVFLNEIV